MEKPIIKPSECPGKVIEWMDKRMDERDDKILTRLDGMDKHYSKFAERAENTRVMVYAVMVFMIILGFSFFVTSCI